MRTLTHLLLATLLFVANCASAQIIPSTQIIKQVMSDESFENYVWAVGAGKSLEEADSNAMSALSTTSVFTSSAETLTNTNTTTNNGTHLETKYDSKSSSVSSIYLENVHREILADKDGMKRVLRYITRADWDARHKYLKSKIEEYIMTGKLCSDVAYKIQYFTWAHILLQTYPNHEDPILADDGTSAQSWLLKELRNILNNIEIYVAAIEHDKSNTHYPYKVYLDFLYKDEPISDLCYSFFDGRGYVENESIKDGRGVVQIKDASSTLTIDIDCLYKNLARQLDATVYLLIDKGQFATTLDEGHKTIDLKNGGVRPQKSVNTASSSVDSKVNEQLKMITDGYVEVSDKVESTRPYTKIMEDITASIKKKGSTDIRAYFTDEAWSQYERIVSTGKPILARTPEYNFIKHDTITICQAIPLKLTFSGNRSFVEDVVFRVNNNTHKIESVAYKLSVKTEQEIMSMDWDDAARLTLITFLEDYRTAYCLEDINYIDKVFADDAYIIVGRVLKQSTRKFSDSANYAFTTTKTLYSHQTKQQYIYNLRKSFNSKEFVNIRFEECNVAKGYYAKEGIYAVQVKQLYYSNNYADEGILTLAIDMREDTHPLVRVRVWQDERDVRYTAEEMIEKTVSVDGSIN